MSLDTFRDGGPGSYLYHLHTSPLPLCNMDGGLLLQVGFSLLASVWDHALNRNCMKVSVGCKRYRYHLLPCWLILPQRPSLASMSKPPCFKEQFLEGRACPLPTALLQDHSNVWQPQADACYQRQRLGSITASLSRSSRGSSGLWISLARLCPHTRDCLPTLMTTLLGRSITKYRKTGSRWPPALQGMGGYGVPA